MIISKTPLRISFPGGGTDYPAWFKEHGGAVLATTIDKYIYLTCRYLPPFFEHTSKIVWSLVEFVKDVDEIQHPSVRECLKFMEIGEGVEIHYDADLPARSGLGSSSAFTVGLLNSLYALKGKTISKQQLALDAITLEQERLKEHVGCQDQIVTAYGGLNLIEFKRGGGFSINPLVIGRARQQELQDNLMLVFTGFTRTASLIAKEWIKQAAHKKKAFVLFQEGVYEGIRLLTGDARIGGFGRLLNDHWRIKRSIDAKISTPCIDQIYQAALRCGASGGKLLGAGGGGFFLLCADRGAQKKIRAKLKKLLIIPFCFENSGSQIIFYNP